MSTKTLVQLHTNYGSLGDQLAFLGAARLYARAHPEEEVSVENLPELVAAFGDGLVKSGKGDYRLDCNPETRHRVRESSPDYNYVGTFAAELGLALEEPPRLELPALPPAPTLLSHAYICLQPYSGFAPSLPRDVIQYLVDVCRHVCPDWPVVVSGSLRTPRDLDGVDYRFLGTPSSVLRIAQHAAAVLTPRSATAHVASAYGVPSFIWIPEDGENWHLNYPDWPHVRYPSTAPPEQVANRLAHFLFQVRAGILSRPNGVQRALIRSGAPNGVRFFQGTDPTPAGNVIDVATCNYPAEIARRILHLVSGNDPGPYPPYLTRGNAAEYVVDEAMTICRGKGIDVGAGDWPFPGALPVRDEAGQNAYSMPQIEDQSLDYVFSSHALEHLHHPRRALEQWMSKLRPGGVLFLYLPHPRMVLWHPEGPWGGDHKWIPSPRQVARWLSELGMSVRVSTEVPDAYWSFRCVAVRPETAGGLA